MVRGPASLAVPVVSLFSAILAVVRVFLCGCGHHGQAHKNADHDGQHTRSLNAKHVSPLV